MTKTRDTDWGQAPVAHKPMLQKDFKRFSEFIYAECGIVMTPAKKTMLEARLHKRLRALGMDSYEEYCDYIFSNDGLEIELFNLIDVVTTNTTEFFREPKHFEILANDVLPVCCGKKRALKQFKFWSAGCSTGEEPYTLAIVLSEFTKTNPGFDFTILATDISTQVLKRSMSAIYTDDKIRQVPMNIKKQYFLRGKNKSAGLVRLCPEIRKRVRFERLNFMEDFHFQNKFDVIFCRNVIIYFDRKTQQTLLDKFCDNLASGGHLFIGHSESITGMNLPVRQVAPTVYQRV